MKTEKRWMNQNSCFGVLGTLLLFVVLSTCMNKAVAADKPLMGTMKSFLVEVDEEGEEVLTETDQVKPGQVIEYALIYGNVTDGNLTDVKIVGPIPTGTVYMADTAEVEDELEDDIEDEIVPSFSIDGGVLFKPEPVLYTVKQADGTEVEHTATPDMYTHVQWTVQNLLAQQKITLKYRVKVK